MKIKNLTFLLIIFTTNIFGQIPEDAISIEDTEFDDYFFNNDNIPIVKGKILNFTEKDTNKTKINYYIVVPFAQRQIKKSCKVNADGTFKLELDYAFSYQQIWLNVGELFYAGLYANSDLYVELDADILKSEKGIYFNGPGIKYLGTDGELNTNLNNHVLYKRKQQLDLNGVISKLKKNRELKYDVFISKYDSGSSLGILG